MYFLCYHPYSFLVYLVSVSKFQQNLYLFFRCGVFLFGIRTCHYIACGYFIYGSYEACLFRSIQIHSYPMTILFGFYFLLLCCVLLCCGWARFCFFELFNTTVHGHERERTFGKLDRWRLFFCLFPASISLCRSGFAQFFVYRLVARLTDSVRADGFYLFGVF